MLPGLLSTAALKALQHLLAQQAWARQVLEQHHGRCLVLGVEGWPEFDVRLVVLPDGQLGADSGDAEPALRFCLKASLEALKDWIEQGPNGLQRHLLVQGDVMLAAAFAQLAQHLRWDFEADLSRLVGDIAAHRIGTQVRQYPERVKALQSRIEGSLSEWLTTESQQLVAQSEWVSHATQLQELGRRIQALEAKLIRLA